jgi:FHA domain
LGEIIHSLYNKFPFTEPQDHWTVEQVLQWHLLKNHAATDRKLEELSASLQRQFEEGQKELLKYYSDVENVPPQQQQQQQQQPSVLPHKKNINSSSLITQSLNDDPISDTKKVGLPLDPTILHVQVTSGPHTGQTLTSYRPTPPATANSISNTTAVRNSAPAWVGRSAGKKFRDKGLSLSQDSEVSTTHGKFEWLGGKPYFTDVGSTNGTSVVDSTELLETNNPLLLYSDLELVLGRSILRIALS